MGKWFYYDEDGLNTDTIDTDAGYEFSYRGVFSYCKKNDISLAKATSGNRTSIYKKVLDGKKVWVIRYPFAQDFYITIVLEGSTGTLIKTTKEPFPREE